MTASIAIATPRPIRAVTPNPHLNDKEKFETLTISSPTSGNKNNMVVRHPIENDAELQDTSSYLPSVHGSHREDGMVDVEASNGARAQSVSGPPPFRYPTCEIGKLVFGAGGIYVSFLYYGSLQEDVFRFKGEDDGQKFVYAWWLQFLEAAANVLVGSVGQRREQQQQSHTTITTAKSLTNSDDASASGCNGHCGNTCNIHATTRQERLPLLPFFASGASQVISKACTSLALAHGLSFPVATLAKSGKMAPVMVGQLILGGSHYSARDYLQVLAIIAGTALLSMGNSSKHHDEGESQSTWVGAFFILLSLAMDGVTAGLQKRLQADLARRGISAHPYDFMLYTNLSMMIVALVIGLHEFPAAWSFCWHHPHIWTLVLSFSACSAIGQSFIFYTVAHFDPLVCSTITTSRKMASVLFSIFVKGHSLSHLTWIGISLALGGVLSEIQAKMVQRRKIKSAT